MRHTAAWLQEAGRPAEFIVGLQPTSPFRQAADIDACLHLIRTTGCDACYTVSPLDFPPEWTLDLDGDRVRLWREEFAPIFSVPRQQLPAHYRQNGAVEVYRSKILLERNELYGKDVRAVVMSARDSLDIDTPLDLEMARVLIAKLV